MNMKMLWVMRMEESDSCSSAEHQVFSTVKEVLSSNILQFQDEKTIIFSFKKMHVEVDPLILRQAAIESKLQMVLFLQINL